MNERIKKLYEQAEQFADDTMNADPAKYDTPGQVKVWRELMQGKFAELLLANADELKREVSTDPINKPFELNPKFVAKCDEIGRSRRQFQ